MVLAPTAFCHSHKTNVSKTTCAMFHFLVQMKWSLFFVSFLFLTEAFESVGFLPVCLAEGMWVSFPRHLTSSCFQPKHMFSLADPSFFSPEAWKLEAGQFLYVTHFILCPDTRHAACKKKLSLCLISFVELMFFPCLSLLRYRDTGYIHMWMCMMAHWGETRCSASDYHQNVSTPNCIRLCLCWTSHPKVKLN